MKLQGGINFRDMGGYRTRGGKKVKNKTFYRSGSLSRLTSEDCKTLESLSICQILDYRDHHESENDKDVVWNGAHHECVPANPVSHKSSPQTRDFFSEDVLVAIPHDFMESLYQKLPFANAAYQALFRKVENLQEGGLVQHCAVGKDRTGMGSALLLLSLGVSRETVMEDYLLTQERLSEYRSEVLKRISGGSYSVKAMDNFHYVMSAKESFLHSGLESILQRYGSFERYFSAEFGLTPEKLEVLQTRFSE